MLLHHFYTYLDSYFFIFYTSTITVHLYISLQLETSYIHIFCFELDNIFIVVVEIIYLIICLMYPYNHLNVYYACTKQISLKLKHLCRNYRL